MSSLAQIGEVQGFVCTQLDATHFAQVAALESQLFADAWSVVSLESLWAQKDETGFGGLVITRTDSSQIAAYLITQCLDVAEVLRIATAPSLQGRGLASAMLEQWLCQLHSAQVSCCLLEVRADNMLAIALYHKFGFTAIHVRRGYYRDAHGAVDALIMQKSLTA